MDISAVFEALQRVESKLDSLGLSSSDPSEVSPADTQRTPSGRPAVTASSLSKRTEHATSSITQSMLLQLRKASACLTAPHKVLLWPSIYAEIMSSEIPLASDLFEIVDEGVIWFARTEHTRRVTTLPAQIALPSATINVSGRPSGSSPNTVFPTLPSEQVRRYCAAYLDTFNLVYPILDREDVVQIQEKILLQGHADGDTSSVILLLVVALGQVSVDGVTGAPISTIDGHASGFRGGSSSNPPGLAAFNEARRRYGFIATDCTLENIQVLLLQMVYLESHARHIDFWRLVTAASTAFLGLMKVQRIDWTSAYGHQARCIFWICALNENFYHFDMDLPDTGIASLEDDVPIPDFTTSCRDDQAIDKLVPWLFHAQFLALITLRAITGRIHDAMKAAEGKYAPM